jgi:parallel beta-helix repeat protein
MKIARLSICALLVLACGCGDSDHGGTAGSVTVNPGQSIQAAVDAAAPGDTITVMPGDYTETHPGTAALRVTKPLKLLAKSDLPGVKVRILPSPGQNHGILVEPAHEGDPDIDGLEINGFTVQGFSNMGIWLRHVKNFTIENNESINNLENGIFPTLSANGLVKKNVAYGSQDSALWVEGSENVRVINNEIHNSPTGLEITISKEITVETNDIHDNTIGVGLYYPATAGLPQDEWPSFDFGNWHILDNYVHDNNSPNTAAEGSETSQLPYGGGILILGVNHVDVKNDRIENNDFFGIAMIDYCIATQGTDFSCSKNPPPVRETSSDYIQLISNSLVNNGTAAPPSPFQGVAADIVGIGGKNNCASGNTAATTNLLPPLPGC